ncbi:unnamed protein product, partial [Citrullus colocynthis]
RTSEHPAAAVVLYSSLYLLFKPNPISYSISFILSSSLCGRCRSPAVSLSAATSDNSESAGI